MFFSILTELIMCANINYQPLKLHEIWLKVTAL